MFSRETQALMEAAVDAIVVIDSRGEIEAVNGAATRAFGYGTDEMVGRNVSLLMSQPDRARHDDYMTRHQETGHARIIGIGREVVAQRRDGTQFPVWLSVGRIPESQPPRFVGLLRDVSAEHEARSALKVQRDRARAYLELHDSILVELDAAHHIREINTRGAERLGGTTVRLVGRDWIDFMLGDSERDVAIRLLDDALASGAPREREFDCIDVQGERRRILWRCIALRNGKGSCAGWLCSGVDVTARAQAEQQAHLAKERLTQVARLATIGEMATGVAHEINQPLTAITTYARACERYLALEQPDLAEVTDALREISAEGLRAGEIIRRLRRMVRLDTPDTRADLEINGLIEELWSLLQSDARAHDVRLLIDLAPGLRAINGNGLHLQQVLLNLVRNGFEALLDRPIGERQLSISTTTDGDDAIAVRIDDNGSGIDPEIAGTLFEPFSTTKQTGTGLGLAMSRTIVQSHGGTITTCPLQPRGTRFVVRLPAAEEVSL